MILMHNIIMRYLTRWPSLELPSWCFIYVSNFCNSFEARAPYGFHQWVPDLQMNCRDFTAWQDSSPEKYGVTRPMRKPHTSRGWFTNMMLCCWQPFSQWQHSFHLKAELPSAKGFQQAQGKIVKLQSFHITIVNFDKNPYHAKFGTMTVIKLEWVIPHAKWLIIKYGLSYKDLTSVKPAVSNLF